MNEKILKNILRFVILVLLQILILNNIQLSGYINPYLYVYFILLLPFETPKWLLLLAAFLMGLIIDLFSHTLGMHIIACVFMAFARPGVTNLISTKSDLEQQGITPSIKDFGIVWFATYASLLVVFHHLVLFYVEIFRWSEFFTTLLRAIFSSLVSVILIVITEYMFYKKR